MQSTDVLIQGAGIVGHALALSLSQAGLRVSLGARSPTTVEGNDVRAYALNAASVALLRQLKVWEALPAHAVTPVYDMRIHGDAQAALAFSAWQQGVAELAWIVDVPALEAALSMAVGFAAHIQTLSADTPPPRAALTAICDGQAFASHAALPGVSVRRWSYDQTAIAARLSTSLPHAGVAQQWFRSPDILALLPCAGGPDLAPAYACVWSLSTERAAALMAGTEAEFEAALAEAVLSGDGSVGDLRLASKRVTWPLSRRVVDPWCGDGWVLVGDAAHSVHPLAGQGLNLGLADVTALTQTLMEREPWRALGDVKLLRRYARRRAAPTQAMGQLTGGLMHLFAHPSPWARELRNRGLDLVQHAPGLKRWLTARALDLNAGASSAP